MEQLIKQININGQLYGIDAKLLESFAKENFLSINGEFNNEFFDAKGIAIKNISEPELDIDVVNKKYVDNAFYNKTEKTLDLGENKKKIINLAEPEENDTDVAVSKVYLDKYYWKLTNDDNGNKKATENINLGGYNIIGLPTSDFSTDDASAAASIGYVKTLVSNETYAIVDEENSGNVEMRAYKPASSIFEIDQHNNLYRNILIKTNEETGEKTYEREWFNPPINEENWIRTLERYDNYPVYIRQLKFNIGDIDKSDISLNFELTAESNFYTIVEYSCFWVSNAGIIQLPYFELNNTNVLSAMVRTNNDKTGFIISTTEEWRKNYINIQSNNDYIIIKAKAIKEEKSDE